MFIEFLVFVIYCKNFKIKGRYMLDDSRGKKFFYDYFCKFLEYRMKIYYNLKKKIIYIIY